VSIGWASLRDEIRVRLRALNAWWNVGEVAQAELEANRLLECLRMAKRWKANGNTPPIGLGDLLEETHADDA
jgi:hypothetical protein